jgi:hypothetical protein
LDNGELSTREGFLSLIFFSNPKAVVIFLRINDTMGVGTQYDDPQASTVLFSLNGPNGANFYA